MNEYELWFAIWLVLLLAVCGLWLAVTSGPSRAWIRRMQRLEEGRARQRAEWIRSGMFYGRDHE